MNEYAVNEYCVYHYNYDICDCVCIQEPIIDFLSDINSCEAWLRNVYDHCSCDEELDQAYDYYYIGKYKDYPNFA